MVYHGANDIRFEEKPRPQIIDPTDAVVKIVKTTICSTDLGIWKAKKTEVADGRILGHEGISIVEEVGEAVKNIKVGNKVIISCVSKCCKCDNCKIQPKVALLQRRLEFGLHDWRHAGRIRPHALCRQQPRAAARQRQRRSRPVVERRFADRTRNRRAIRRCQTRRHRIHRRCRSCRYVRLVDRPTV